ncbi:hypothetical protein H0H81_012359 [Sphagnurus paluster]|uniref:Uncharacterized protein n=1 Tax=Sphagnurus paluster TaxID=117069 RepID=A0A9P7KM85_9AGAR|nr:hypothetical protein H0H81_012359 [Sphagnurus paluster]
MAIVPLSTPQVIRENAPYHAQIIGSITELDYVPSALSHQTSYLKDLQEQLAQSETRLKELSAMTMRERKEHEALRDSTARRLAHKLTGRKEKFQAKASREEREYVEALEKELTERDNQNVLRQMLEEAEQVRAELSEKAQRHATLKTQLSDLYLQIFDGPTEGTAYVPSIETENKLTQRAHLVDFPEDDRLEYELQTTQTLHDQVQSTLNAECQAAEILTRADKTINACKGKVNEALGYSQYGMYTTFHFTTH